MPRGYCRQCAGERRRLTGGYARHAEIMRLARLVRDLAPEPRQSPNEFCFESVVEAPPAGRVTL